MTMSTRAKIWDSAPFLRLLPPLITGIYLGRIWPCPINVQYAGICASMVLSFCLATKIWIPRYAWRWIPGLSINILLLITGSCLFWHQQIFHRSTWFGHHLQHAKFFSGTPQAIATPGKKSNRIIFTISSVLDSVGHQKPVEGSIIVYIPNTSNLHFLPGDQWLFTAESLQQIRSSKNPGSFDYAEYCARQNIYHQAYLQESQITFISPPAKFHLSRLLAIGQISALRAMREAVPENASGLAMALLIGYRNEVEKSVLQAYTNTGVVHVIAVSGMHLGLIFMLLQKMLIFPDRRFRIFKWFKALLILLIIWLFSGIAGAAASIIRAAFMFSAVLLAKLLRKTMDNIQSICLGAFALLCYNPLWLWDAGFQLSFAALLSIICYQPLISAWINVRNPILKGIWDLAAVTLAAQVLTLPISIGQFHQAPVYFLVANLLAVPLSSLALITAILQWIISAAGLQFYLPGKITGLLIRQMDAAILHINSLPGAVIDHVEWSPLQTVIVYILIISFSVWCIRRSKIAACTSMLSIIFFQTLGVVDAYIKSRQEYLLAFQLPKQRIVALVQGWNMKILSPGKLSVTPELVAAKRYYQVKNKETLTGKLFRYRNLLIALPEDPQTIPAILQSTPDYLFLPGGLHNIDPYLPFISANTMVVIDGTIPEWRARQWCLVLHNCQLRYYSTWESGALQIPINKF